VRSFVLLSAVLVLLAGCSSPYPSVPGNIFLKVRVLDEKAWRKGFETEIPILKSQGFQAYSLHQDLSDPQSLLLTLKCGDLKKGLRFAKSGNLLDLPTVMGKQVVWAGTDVQERSYLYGISKGTSGIVIVRHQVKDFDFWYKGYQHASGGTHHHPDRGYIPSRRSVHRVPGDPAAALVVHAASNVSKARAFMETQNMRDRMEAGGVIGTPEIWYGIDIEEGLLK
jgi:hypothetical protein